MKILYFFAFIFFGMLLFVSCEKKETIDVVDTTPIYFVGIHKTDANGLTLEVDSTDWRWDDIWNTRELELFHLSNQNQCAEDESFQIVAFPNPCDNVFQLYLNKAPTDSIQLKIVDRNYNVKAEFGGFNNGIQFNTETFGITNDTVRVYYKVKRAGACSFYGHGDVIIN
ncbi:MAG: hypothetical protein KBA06_02575 [Saprospiraceae bacterium]|nr:hypothetical protein [Saprospiraceae bacterium]